MKWRWICGAALAAVAVALLAPATAVAHDVNDGSAAFCEWVVVPSSNVRADSDHDHNALAEWYWNYGAVAGPFSVYAEIEGESWDWGFPSVSKANSGDGHYIIQRLQVCEEPREDIEATGKNQFKASAALDSDEVARAAASMNMWAAKMRSNNRPPANFRCHAEGGAECTATPRLATPDGTVSLLIAGLGGTVNIFSSSGASAEAIFDSSDSGSNGHSPETIDLLNKSSVTLDLDSFDVGSAYILESRMQLRVLGTCDGACKVIRVLIDWNTY